MGKIICQHWHCYQPSGNDFYTSAINDECYRPNSYNGILNRISFNMGPTLMEWFENNDQTTLQKVLEADHGQAMAQPYNHRILPLTRYDEDLKTQIRWGKEHFRNYFGRSPRVMWLPETATDVRTCKALSGEDIEYTIGAQAQAISEGGLVDTSKAYSIDLGDGDSISYFFYHPRSTSIAFNDEINSNSHPGVRYLENADIALEAILEEVGDSSLVLLAYDGETFGHHNPFADLWAEYFPIAVDKLPSTEMITLEEYLDTYGTSAKADLVENSSWSCTCGDLKRWKGGCTCAPSTPEYREELLAALETQEDKIHDIFFTHGRKKLKDPWEARDDYIHVLLAQESFENMIRKHTKNEPTEHDINVLKGLFEAEYFNQLSFTSCGWFFPEVHVQTKKNIDSAHKAAKRIKDSLGYDVSSSLKDIQWMLDHNH